MVKQVSVIMSNHDNIHSDIIQLPLTFSVYCILYTIMATLEIAIAIHVAGYPISGLSQ